MKKKLFVLPLLALLAGGTLASCGGDEEEKKPDPYVPCQHVDDNHDGKCDKCGQGGIAVRHIDTNGDYKCDKCGQWMDHEHEDLDENGKCDICGADVPIPVKEPETFAGFKRVLIPEDGKQYLLGMYQPNNAKMIFMNGSPHRDPAGDYPFYLGCNDFPYTGREDQKEAENDVDIETGAVKVEINYLDGSDELFTIKFVDGTGKETPQYYHGYLGIYGDYNKNVKTSLKFSPSLGDTYSAWTNDDMKIKASCTDHVDKNEDGKCDICAVVIDAEEHACVDSDYNGLCDVCNKTLVKEAPVSHSFRVMKDITYDGKTKKDKYAIVSDFSNQCDEKNLTRNEPVALGTWDTYNNIECITTNNILESFVAHLWEKIEPAE